MDSLTSCWPSVTLSQRGAQISLVGQYEPPSHTHWASSSVTTRWLSARECVSAALSAVSVHAVCESPLDRLSDLAHSPPRHAPEAPAVGRDNTVSSAIPRHRFSQKCVPLLSGCPRRRHTAAIGVVLRARYAPTRWLHTTSSPGGVARSSVIAAPICSKCPHCVGGGEPGRAHLVGRGDADRALVWLGVCVVAT